ncbi:MAG TPA: NAD(P)-dependent glycerol-3-phosphate dehydrogenase [Chromatiales bacterium]|nr:NAD(P)-dependent glycerol-3-phosphate dehydrogenase [Chromatiales bacterium]
MPGEALVPRPFAVLGAGAWGTALAVQLARRGRTVRLWSRDPAHAAEMARVRRNERHLPGVALPEGLEPTSDEAQALAGGAVALVAVPSAAFREVLRRFAPGLRAPARVAWATKGLEPGTGRLLHEVLAEEIPGARAAAVSGPTFAREVAAGLPTALTVASPDAGFAREVAGALHGGTLRAYTSGDLVGVELGGAVKNVLAIAAGIADGLGLGANTRAALITRGLAEMTRLGRALGGRPETFMGLAGLGDLVLTCTDDQSRNRRLGLALGRGLPPPAALAEVGAVVEGAHTAAEVVGLAARHAVEMPICEQVSRVLAGERTPTEAAEALLAREPKAEVP